MKRKWLALVSLLAIAAMLTACSSQQPTQTFAEVTQYLGPAVTDTPVPINNNASGVSDADTPQDQTGSDGQSVFASNPYVVDPNQSVDTNAALNEEEALGAQDGEDTGTLDNAPIVYGQDDANATVYPYAGSSPIPLDPIDAPTATPRTAITFTYVQYDVPALGLSFQGPAGWVPDESVSETYTLSEPEEQIKDGQLGILNIYAVPVNSNYNENSLTTEIKDRLNTIGATNFTEWKPSLTATRFLMGSKGVYANYSGTLATGVKVGGRIHATSINNVLYCVQITYPLGFKDDYLNVFSKVRETIQRTTK